MFDMLEKSIHDLDLLIFNMRQDASLPSGQHLAEFEKRVVEAAEHRSSCEQTIQSLSEKVDELHNELSRCLVLNVHDAKVIADIGHQITLKEQQIKDLVSNCLQ
ncbi:uncharacterized protein LOC117102196 [Anneissia japonica]|uniref:uncharacterized protein LOC117102196 n=1 Tax=Anneissia japonica TaxID=1529436 RepID=UPI001425B9F8|nr:uncharacterized protein LOC117102196 [Anneissia japonica]